MNFLLGASLIILLLFPGLVFRLAYYSTRHGRGFSFTLVEALVVSIIPTALIHLLCMPLTLSYGLNFSELYLIVISDKSGATAVTLASVSGYLKYCLLTYAIAGLAGFIIQRIVRVINLDINIPGFRIHNEWYYQLRGGIVFSSRWRIRRFMRADVVQLDAVVELGKEAYLYSGVIRDFILSKDEGVDRIFLKDAVRQKLIREPVAPAETPASEPLTEEAVKDLISAISRDPVSPAATPEELERIMPPNDDVIPGDNFCLLFKEIKNLNLTYFNLIEVE